MLSKKLFLSFLNLLAAAALVLLPTLADATANVVWLRYSKPIPNGEAPDYTHETNDSILYCPNTSTTSFICLSNRSIKTYLYPKPAMVDSNTSNGYINWTAISGIYNVACGPSSGYASGYQVLNATLALPPIQIVNGNELQLIYVKAACSPSYPPMSINTEYIGANLPSGIAYQNAFYTLTSCIDDPTDPPYNSQGLQLGARHIVCKYLLSNTRNAKS